MAFEVGVASSEIGVARTTDVLCDVSVEATSVVLLVLREGAPPVQQRIAIGELLGGRGLRRGIVCPICARPKYRLFAAAFGLGCGPCTRRRSRRQIEHRSHAWRRLGGALEDVVLRGLGPGRGAAFVSEAVRDASATLMSDDRERVVLLLRRAEDAVKLATTPTVGVRDVLAQAAAWPADEPAWATPLIIRGVATDGSVREHQSINIEAPLFVAEEYEA